MFSEEGLFSVEWGPKRLHGCLPCTFWIEYQEGVKVQARIDDRIGKWCPCCCQKVDSGEDSTASRVVSRRAV